MKTMLKHEGFCSLGGQSENDLRSRSLSLALRASLTFSALMQSTCGKTMQTSLLLISCFRNAFITHSFANDPCTFFKPLNASRLALFRKLENVYQGKTQCLAICFISKDSLTIIVLEKGTKQEKKTVQRNRKQRHQESNPVYLHIQATPSPLHHSDTHGMKKLILSH